MLALLLLPARAAEHGAVASVHPLATRAGVEALRAGGNAVDAAIACALTLGVVDGFNSGLGGGCFLTIRLADGRYVAIDGRENAPAAATREMFVREGRAVPALSQFGAHAVGVPGELAALAYASTNFGRLPLARLLEGAARVAEEGFPLTRTYAGRLKSAADELAALTGEPPAAQFAAFRAIFLPEGRPVMRAGDTLRQPELAASYRAMAHEGPAWFYRGPFAARTADWMRQHGGLLNEADFAAYEPKRREPVRATYRGFEIVSFPPPSSGGVHGIQILNLLENFELKAMGRESADFAHVVAEAMKLAFADRAHWLGDPDFAPVPRGLVAKDYARELARRIALDRAAPVAGHGTPPAADTDVFGREAARHTTHFSMADGEGIWAAVTATVNTTFGAKVVVPGTGIVLNNQMDDFAAQPGVPNFFGLPGAEANAVQPRKRPLSSMAPTIILKNGRPVLAVGAAGGPTIISQTVLAILGVVDFGLDPAAALAAPRLHHQWRPDELVIERAFGEAVAAELRRRGHAVKPVGELGSTQAVGLGPGGLVAAPDPRGEGAGEAW
ncbi:MAG TPA: gamma-glutamyltransferase [Lacipirellulaceae bacterium]|nr:gamma-glutamyltransferase [Lacipirellulaceae bacterium]